MAGGGRSVLRKRSNSIRFGNSFRSLKEPLQHLPDSNGWLYSLQLNTYRYILESEYSMRVSSMYLAQVHPCLPRARLIEVPRMQEELDLIVEDQINRAKLSAERCSRALYASPATKGSRTHRLHACASVFVRANWHVRACPANSMLPRLVREAQEMKFSSGSVVSIEGLPYPAWRLLIDYLWRDFTFGYFVVPRFRDDCTITVELLKKAGPRYQAPTAYPEAGGRGEAQVDAHGGEPPREEKVSQRRELGSRRAARLGLRDHRRDNLAGAAHVAIDREHDAR